MTDDSDDGARNAPRADTLDDEPTITNQLLPVPESSIAIWIGEAPKSVAVDLLRNVYDSPNGAARYCRAYRNNYEGVEEVTVDVDYHNLESDL